MGGNDAAVAIDAELFERLGGVPHGLPVGLASHDDGDGSGHRVNSSQESKNIGRIIGSGPMSARRGKGAGMHYPVLAKSGKSPNAPTSPFMPMKSEFGHPQQRPQRPARGRRPDRQGRKSATRPSSASFGPSLRPR